MVGETGLEPVTPCL